MSETVTIEIDGQTFEIDIAKMNSAIDALGWGTIDSAKRNFKKGKYVNVIDRIILNRFGTNIEEITNEQRIIIAKELV